MSDLSLFAFAASSREGSYNQRLLKAALNHIGDGVQLDHEPDYSALMLPNYEETAATEQAVAIAKRVKKADALIISAPEFNWSMPGSLKNIIDWVSHADIKAFNGKPVLLLCASPSSRGGIVGLTQLRVPLEVLGAWVYPQLITLGKSHEHFDAQGNITAQKERIFMEQCVTDFIAKAKTLQTTS